MWAKRVVVSLAALVLAASAVSAQTITRGPLIQNPNALTTTVTILWWTDVAGNSTVDYGTTVSLGQSVTVGQAASCQIGAAGTCHSVTLTGLSAGTRYYYRLVVNGVTVQAASASIYFTTLKDPSDPSDLFFTVIGDWGQNSTAEQNVANRQDAADPQMITTVGDNFYQTGTQTNVDDGLDRYVTPFKRIFFFPSLGNHDVSAASWSNSAYVKTFSLPTNAPDQERYYSYDSGDAHFVMLDSNNVDSTQTSWLDNDLATTTRRWKFVFLHHTPYSCASGLFSIGSDLGVRNTWGPIFESRAVDIVFTGHDHIYERSGFVNDFGGDSLGTYYVMSGGGGATLDGAAVISGGLPKRSGSTCYWLANDPVNCPNGVSSGANRWCSVATFQYTSVRIVGNATMTLQGVDQNGNVFDTFSITKTCGDSSVGAGEQCDQGAANGTAGSCCMAACQYKAAGTQCRANAGTCDVAESCSGSSATCPADGFQSVGSVCRAASGLCDVAETCSGSSAACPADALATVGTVCRSASGGCDVAESCTGSSNACPADGFAAAGVVCRATAGSCDLSETCTGASAACPADAKSTALCRAAAGGCDSAESCDGVGNDCPADSKSTALCRPAADVCDAAESCDGVGNDCPPDAKSTAQCRAPAGTCDAAESCDGVNDACPADALAAAGTVCRPAVGTCDVAETCSGAGASCPTDTFVAAGTSCRAAAGVCDVAESCSGASGTCPADAKSTAVCRTAAGPCDVVEICNGSSNDCPADGFAPTSTVCRLAVGACDVPENCTGAGVACPANGVAAAGTVCRPPAGGCDAAETCNGSSSSCPIDGLSLAGTVCRAAAGVCDVAETCSGSSATCPADAKSTAQCRAAVGACDVAEQCNGVTNTCPVDALVTAGVECRPSGGPCDPAETCTGSSIACPADARSTAVCRPAVGPCDVAESCDGVGVGCPADQVAPPTVECRPAIDPCDVAEFCTGSSGACPADTGEADGDGDGFCDAEDDCPADFDPAQADTDGDTVGDACDPCTNGVAVLNPKVTVTKQLTPGGDDRLTFKGDMTFPFPFNPVFYPVSVGARVVLMDAEDNVLVDALIPTGFYSTTALAGWTASGSGAWTYKNSIGIQGIVKVVLKPIASLPGLIKFTVSGKYGTWPLTVPRLPVRGTMVVDAPTALTGQCGEATFPGLPGPTCAFNTTGNTVKCK